MKEMFTSARIRLTVWYVAIIMLISTVFSLMLFRLISLEIQQTFETAERRFHQQLLPPGMSNRVHTVFEDNLKLAKTRTRNRLLLANMFIFFSASVASYQLAGSTLSPIKQALKRQKRFVGDAAHELRTPLTALKTSMEVALRNQDIHNSATKQVLQENLTTVDEMQQLTNSLLQLAQFYEDEDLNFQLIPVQELVEELRTQTQSQVQAAQVKLDFTYDHLQVEVHKNLFKQMLIILIDNALKFSQSGDQITVRFKKLGRKLQVEVQDTGIGIEEADKPHIFERFFQTEASRSKSKKPAFGLGLSLAKQIAQRHHGNISVSSKKGQGSTFTIHIPLHQ